MSSWHPLFPKRDDEPANARPPKIAYLHVKKYLKGEYQSYPVAFGPGDITSLGEVYDRWGGGRYEFCARNEEGQLSRKHRETIAGAPKPFLPDEEERAQADPGAAAAAAAAAAGGGGSNWLAAVTAVAPFLLQYLSNQQSLALQQSQQTQALMVTLLERGSSQSQEHIHSMAELYRTLTESMGKMTQGSAAGGATSEAFLKGIETGRDLFQGALEAQGGEVDDNSLMQMVTGAVQAIHEMSQQAKPAVAPVPQPAPEPGEQAQAG